MDHYLTTYRKDYLWPNLPTQGQGGGPGAGPSRGPGGGAGGADAPKMTPEELEMYQACMRDMEDLRPVDCSCPPHGGANVDPHRDPRSTFTQPRRDHMTNRAPYGPDTAPPLPPREVVMNDTQYGPNPRRMSIEPSSRRGPTTNEASYGPDAVPSQPPREPVTNDTPFPWKKPSPRRDVMKNDTPSGPNPRRLSTERPSLEMNDTQLPTKMETPTTSRGNNEPGGGASNDIAHFARGSIDDNAPAGQKKDMV